MNTPEKNRKMPKVIGIIVGTVVILLVYVVTFIMIFDETDVPNSMKDIVSIFTCITAALSAVFSGMGVAVTLKQHQENCTITLKQHQENIQAAIFSRWFNEIILNRHLDKIKDFCNHCEMLISEFKEIDDQKDQLTVIGYENQIQEHIVTPFTDKYTCVHKNLVSDLALIDRSLSLDISKTFQELQDRFVNELGSSRDSGKMYDIVQEFNSSIMKQLMGYNKKIMQGKGLSNWISK